MAWFGDVRCGLVRLVMVWTLGRGLVWQCQVRCGQVRRGLDNSVGVGELGYGEEG